MDLIPKLSAIIIIAVLVTILIAVFSYIVFKMREHRSPDRLRRESEKRKFFKRFSLNG